MGETKRFIEHDLESWNAHDKRAWTADIADDCELKAPGGVSGKGRDLRETFYSMWTDGFPDNRIKPVVIAEDGENGVLEAVFEGTHTGTLNAPSGPIPATRKRVSVPFVSTTKVRNAKFTSLHLYFDQVELLTQLGLMPATTAAKA